MKPSRLKSTLHPAPSTWSWALNSHTGHSSPLERFPTRPSQLLQVWRQGCACASATVYGRSGINEPVLLLPGIQKTIKLFFPVAALPALLKDPPLLRPLRSPSLPLPGCEFPAQCCRAPALGSCASSARAGWPGEGLNPVW